MTAWKKVKGHIWKCNRCLNNSMQKFVKYENGYRKKKFKCWNCGNTSYS